METLTVCRVDTRVSYHVEALVIVMMMNVSLLKKEASFIL